MNSKKMNILFISSDNNPAAGAFRSMAKLCELLNKDENINIIVILPKEGKGVRLLSNVGVKYHVIRSCSWVQHLNEHKTILGTLKMQIKRLVNVFAIMRICVTIKYNKIDIVHINTISSYVGAVAARLCKVPVVWHIREALDVDQDKCLYDDKAYSIINKAKYTLYISEFIKNHYPQISMPQNAMIYNGIDEKEYYYKRTWNKDEQEVVHFLNVGYMGNEKKGQILIIQAASELVARGITNFDVTMVGSGNKEKEYIRRVSEAGISDKFYFLGELENTRDEYKKADVFIMSSSAEAFGRVTVEAMMAGCLIIGSNSGATPEILEKGKSGILFEANNSQSLTDAMEKVIHNFGDYEDIAKKGQQYALKNFNALHNKTEVLRIYEDIIAGQ
ncbi:glycosyltransferase family 4 protein [Butyrivibrio sp. INlla16]|uniref:glycosyltransferase family 4 protein n=1 Tax=Butyrivibrio sp. INlla16 TaxID=1520807 RepID=UPI0008840C23|nr:glycosyltransferase family 4 protein [Butyrivibrio sp. INlla16]SDB09754.1 hypothetical protein SAMN02910263_00429 [Butyrivibrio sp. INlla16]